MFQSAGQLYYALICICLGGLAGVLKTFFPHKGALAFFTDFLFFLLLSAAFLYAEYLFRFPDFRPYTWAVTLLSFLAVRKILSQSVAKGKNMWYNRGKKRKKSAKTAADRSIV